MIKVHFTLKFVHCSVRTSRFNDFESYIEAREEQIIKKQTLQMSAIFNKDPHPPPPTSKCVAFIVLYKCIIYCIYWGGNVLSDMS